MILIWGCPMQTHKATPSGRVIRLYSALPSHIQNMADLYSLFTHPSSDISS